VARDCGPVNQDDVAPSRTGLAGRPRPDGARQPLQEAPDCMDVQWSFARGETVLSVGITVQGLDLFLEISVKAARQVTVIQVGYSFREIP